MRSGSCFCRCDRNSLRLMTWHAASPSLNARPSTRDMLPQSPTMVCAAVWNGLTVTPDRLLAPGERALEVNPGIPSGNAPAFGGGLFIEAQATAMIACSYRADDANAWIDRAPHLFCIGIVMAVLLVRAYANGRGIRRHGLPT